MIDASPQSEGTINRPLSSVGTHMINGSKFRNLSLLMLVGSLLPGWWSEPLLHFVTDHKTGLNALSPQNTVDRMQW